MFRSHYVVPVTARPRNTGSMFELVHINQATSESQRAGDSLRRDPRPLGQRLDDEEDLQLIRQRKWMQGYRLASLVVVVVILFTWFVSQ